MRLHVIFLATTALSAASVRTSEACSPPPCGPGYFVPTTNATVPANIPALYWRPIAGNATRDPQLVTLAVRTNPTVALPFTATRVGSSDDYLLVPEQPLTDGLSYALHDNNVCLSSGITHVSPNVSFQAGPAAPLPTELGQLQATMYPMGTFEVATSSGLCTTELQAATTSVSLLLTAEAAPWRDALHFETLVDGVRWHGSLVFSAPPGSSEQGRGRDTLFRICHTDDSGAVEGLDGSLHQVMMRATLPGTDLVLTTGPVPVQLECAPAPMPDGLDTIEPEPSGGCGCATNRGASSVWLAFSVALALRRRRTVSL